MNEKIITKPTTPHEKTLPNTFITFTFIFRFNQTRWLFRLIESSHENREDEQFRLREYEVLL